MSPEKRANLRAYLEQRIERTKLFDYRPYAKQRLFHTLGFDYRERLFMAGNQLGKTLAGGFEFAMHATGRYPDWWDGRVFDHEIVAWSAGVTGELTRDGPQRILMGRAGSWGTGAIPHDAIEDTIRKSHGVRDALEAVIVRHGGGGDVQAGRSRIQFKSYDQGREKFQAETIDAVWFDEEPDLDLYTEGLTRTNAGDRGRMGMVYLTFTPLKGMSQVVERFMIDEMPGTVIVQMGIGEAEHYTPAQRAAIIASYPEHERDARTQGTPAFGSGKVFPIAEQTIVCDPFLPPNHYPCIGGLDFGWDHPSAAVKLHHDRDGDIVYVSGVHRMREATPLMFAEGIKPWGLWLPYAWPHDGLQHDKGSGVQLAELYRKQGLNMLPKPASFSEDKLDNSTEAGIAGIFDMMQSGRFKVMSHLTAWWEEFRTYHRGVDGVIVKKRDDLMSATRIAYMCLRHAIRKPSPRVTHGKPINWRTR